MPLYDFDCLGGHRFERHVVLAKFDAPQFCECGDEAARVISAPRLVSGDIIAPILGPDGQTHTSLSTYRASLKPDGNPQGERYLELGDHELPHAPPKFDRKQRRDDIKAAIEDVKNGRVAQAVTGDLP